MNLQSSSINMFIFIFLKKATNDWVTKKNNETNL